LQVDDVETLTPIVGDPEVVPHNAVLKQAYPQPVMSEYADVAEHAIRRRFGRDDGLSLLFSAGKLQDLIELLVGMGADKGSFSDYLQYFSSPEYKSAKKGQNNGNSH